MSSNVSAMSLSFASMRPYTEVSSAWPAATARIASRYEPQNPWARNNADGWNPR
jgi:hypothetical protein